MSRSCLLTSKIYLLHSVYISQRYFDSFYHSFVSCYLILVEAGMLRYRIITSKKNSVADPDAGSGAFLTPGSGVRDE
jgi:hypothetical protein